MSEVLMSNNILSIFIGVNDASGGWLAGLLLGVLFFIIMSGVMTFTGLEFQKALIMSSFVMVILSFLFWSIELVGLWLGFVFLALLIINIGIQLFRGS